MSKPKLPEENNLNREEAVNLILTSIAMEELGLSHILNAEGEKLQYVLGTAEGMTGRDEPPTVKEILEVNKSVRRTLSNATRLQMMLGTKMESAKSMPTMQGPTGPQGPAGSTGPQGAQGREGPRGEQGMQGPAGPQGPQGPEGPEGPQGLLGPTGAQGPQGLQGIPGENGFAGIIVRGNYDPTETYYVNDYVVSDQGNGFVARVDNPSNAPPDEFVSNDEWAVFVAAGAPGKQGVQGQEGQIGPIGPAGPRGSEGPRGEQGTQGPMGPEGPRGAEGPQGVQGLRGLPGPTGATGAQGLEGDTGATGSAGPEGPPGADGKDGKDGEAATIAAGTVTMLPYDKPPTVENVGTSTNAKFNFGIPEGPPRVRVYRANLSTATSPALQIPLGNAINYQLQHSNTNELSLFLRAQPGLAQARCDYRIVSQFDASLIAPSFNVFQGNSVAFTQSSSAVDTTIYSNTRETHRTWIRVQNPNDAALWSTYEVNLFSSQNGARIIVWVNVIDENGIYQ